MDEDVLRELSTPEIVKLSDFYVNYEKHAPQIYGYLRTALKWRETHPETSIVQVFALNDACGGGWEVDGTFVSIAHFPWKMLMMYTLENNCNRLYNALVKTNRFEYQKDRIFFYAIAEHHVPMVDKAMHDRGLKKVDFIQTHFWQLPQEQGILKTLSDVPDDLILRQLTLEDCNVINDNWAYKSQGSDGYIKMLIELNNSGYGVYTKDTNCLVAWILKTQLGQMGNLYVSPGHHRRGLASALMNILTKEITANGFNVLATVVTDNVAAHQLFSKAGFKRLSLCAFMVYQ